MPKTTTNKKVDADELTAKVRLRKKVLDRWENEGVKLGPESAGPPLPDADHPLSDQKDSKQK